MTRARRGRTSHDRTASARVCRICSGERASGVTGLLHVMEDAEDDLDQDEHDDEYLEELRTEVRRLVGEYLVDALQHLQLLPHVLLPFGQVEAHRQQPVRPRQVL